jgi:hypothetical protein
MDGLSVERLGDWEWWCESMEVIRRGCHSPDWIRARFIPSSFAPAQLTLRPTPQTLFYADDADWADERG